MVYDARRKVEMEGYQRQRDLRWDRKTVEGRRNLDEGEVDGRVGGVYPTKRAL
jgi:hypothetical protein